MHLQNVEFHKFPGLAEQLGGTASCRELISRSSGPPFRMSHPYVIWITYRADHFATFLQGGICCQKMPGSATPTSFARSPAGLVYSERSLKAGPYGSSQNPRF